MLGTMKIGNSKPKTTIFDKDVLKNTTPKDDWKDIQVGMSLLTTLLQAIEKLIFFYFQVNGCLKIIFISSNYAHYNCNILNFPYKSNLKNHFDKLVSNLLVTYFYCASFFQIFRTMDNSIFWSITTWVKNHAMEVQSNCWWNCHKL